MEHAVQCGRRARWPFPRCSICFEPVLPQARVGSGQLLVCPFGARTVRRVCVPTFIREEHEGYILQDVDSDLFQKPCCNYDEAKGIGSFEFWRDLPHQLKKRWLNLRLVGMKTGTLADQYAIDTEATGAHHPRTRAPVILIARHTSA
jgi:hypothetical protein